MLTQVTQYADLRALMARHHVSTGLKLEDNLQMLTQASMKAMHCTSPCLFYAGVEADGWGLPLRAPAQQVVVHPIKTYPVFASILLTPCFLLINSSPMDRCAFNRPLIPRVSLRSNLTWRVLTYLANQQSQVKKDYNLHLTRSRRMCACVCMRACARACVCDHS